MTGPQGDTRPSFAALAAAWGVHFFTASGAVLGLLAVAAATRGDALASFWWMAATVAVDSVDGFLARRLRVKKVLPGVDGALLDNIVDFFTYTVVPAWFLLQVPLLPAGGAWPAVAAILYASAYQFSRSDAKTDDHTFSGFPSYWNIVVFYLYMTGTPPALNLAVILLCCFASFLPLRCLYPSRTKPLRPLTVALGLLWAASLLAVMFRYPAGGHHPYLAASWVYIAYYCAFSGWLTARGGRREGKTQGG